jgi:hypothetical protein
MLGFTFEGTIVPLKPAAGARTPNIPTNSRSEFVKTFLL